MRRSDFDFHLPEPLIAQRPLGERSASRLLALDGPSGLRQDLRFRDLPGLLRPGDLLVFNNTRVLPARLFANKPTGGRVEILIERLRGESEALAHVRASKAPSAGTELRFPGGASVTVVGREQELFVLRATNQPLAKLIRRHGHMPLPPYIRRADDASDAERYQTVFAEREGAVAAPTAGLHFDQPLLEVLAEAGVGTAQVTLHVGAGTFQPVREENLDRHQMHAEWLEVGEQTVAKIRATRAGGHRVIAVGTTTVRSLETAAAASDANPLQAYRGESRLFIRPGYRFQVTDAMITNFHLPRSTLLMLVSAFAGHQQIMAAYRHAIEREYRFFSYGDAMFLTRRG